MTFNLTNQTSDFDRKKRGPNMIGSGEILVILVVILILFGGKRLPEFAQSLGKGIREFKKACYGEEDEIKIHPNSQEMKTKTTDSTNDSHIILPRDSSNEDS